MTKKFSDEVERLDKEDEIKKKLYRAYGPRIPDTYKNQVTRESTKRMNEFYSPIDENTNEELNKKLQNQFQIQKNKVIDYNFDEVNQEYIQKYTKFLRDQQNFDGLRKFSTKLTAKMKKLKYLLLHIPELETPRIYKVEDKKKSRLNKRKNELLGSNKDSSVGTLMEVSKLMKEKESLNLEILREYERKMDLVRNRLAKYDVEGSSDGILGEIERYLKFGVEVSEDDVIENDLNEIKDKEVDRIIQGKERLRNDMRNHKRGGWMKIDI